MPVAVIAVSMLIMLVVATRSDASPSCMSKTEAGQQFGSMHIYWHGRDHCWDATPTRRLTRNHQNHKGQQNRRIHEIQRNNDRPKWHESVSEMLHDVEPAQTAPLTPWRNRWVDIEHTPPLNARWVDIAQTKPPSVIELKPEPLGSPRVVLLTFTTIAVGLTLATIESLFRRTVS